MTIEEANIEGVRIEEAEIKTETEAKNEEVRIGEVKTMIEKIRIEGEMIEKAIIVKVWKRKVEVKIEEVSHNLKEITKARNNL